MDASAGGFPGFPASFCARNLPYLEILAPALMVTSRTDETSVFPLRSGTTVARQREGWSVESQIFFTFGSTSAEGARVGEKSNWKGLPESVGASALGEMDLDGGSETDGGNETGF